MTLETQQELEREVQSLRRRVRELEALREIALATASSLEAEEVLRAVGERARELFGADHASLVLGSPGEEPLPPGLPGEVLEGGARVVHDAAGLRSLIAAPLRHGEEVHGVLLIGWEERTSPDEEAVRLAETLAAQVAGALHGLRLYEELRRTAARRDRFFSAISHDLRTPITAIVGYSELLLDGIVGDLAEKQEEMVERISQVAGHLSELVNDILDLARLDAGRLELHPEPLPVAELVEEAVVSVEPQARGKGLSLRLELDGLEGRVLRADPVRARQVLENLLSNAVKFTERGEVRVSAGVGEGRGWIAVRDTGPGLPEGGAEAVFEEFLQLASGSGTKREPGSGLGLAVSRRLARAMGGDLTAESTPGRGSTFTLHLPLGEE